MCNKMKQAESYQDKKHVMKVAFKCSKSNAHLYIEENRDFFTKYHTSTHYWLLLGGIVHIYIHISFNASFN